MTCGQGGDGLLAGSLQTSPFSLVFPDGVMDDKKGQLLYIFSTQQVFELVVW